MEKSLRKQLNSIKHGWDQAATEDAINYIMGSGQRRNVDLRAFFHIKKQQAEGFTGEFFHQMRFYAGGKRMLDIGCGIGAMTRYFAEIFAEAHGVDISEEMIRMAIELNRDEDRLFFRTGNGFDLSMYQDDFFDFCFSFATFQYFPHVTVVANWFREIARILNPGGLFKVQLDGRKWVASRIPIPIYRPLYNFLRNSSFLTVFGKLITDGITVKAYRGMAISWKAVVDILRPLPLQDITVTGKDTSSMWVSGRKHWESDEIHHRI